jgi:hypothetical protein
VRRSAAAIEPRDTADAHSTDSATASPASRSAAGSVPASQIRPAPRPVRTVATERDAAATVRLDCIAAPGVVVVGDLATPSDRRIARDIVLAIAGATASVSQAEFRWPVTQTGDSGPDARASAFRGFLHGQVERAAARRLLLLGARVATLLPDRATLGAAEVLHVSDAGALRADPAAKERLWRTVCQPDRA